MNMRIENRCAGSGEWAWRSFRRETRLPCFTCRRTVRVRVDGRFYIHSRRQR